MKASKLFPLLLFLLVLAVAAIFYFKPITPTLDEDKDGNGLWDDVDEKINARFPNPLLRKAATQLAITIQDGIKDPDNAIKIERVMARAESCNDFIYQKIKPGSLSKEIEIRDMVVTNRDRERKWIRFNVKLSGGMYEMLPEDKINCDFDTGF